MSGGAIIASAVIGVGTSLYSADQQKSAADKAQKERDRLAAEEEARLDQIAADTKPIEEGATIDFGETDDGTENGSYNDFLVQKSSTSKLGTSGTSGLNSGGLTSLGMN